MFLIFQAFQRSICEDYEEGEDHSVSVAVAGWMALPSCLPAAELQIIDWKPSLST